MTDKDPATVRALWEPMGWSSLFADALGEPELDKSRQEVKRLMAGYRSWGGAFKLQLKDLPKQFRLAFPDHQGFGFSITDESPHSEEPPMLGISADLGTIEPSFPSYLRWAGTLLVSMAFPDWETTLWRSRPGPADLRGATRPFPTLSPASLKLAEEVWALPRNAWSEQPGERLLFRSFEALAQWLVSLEGLQALSFESLPGDVWALRVAPDKAFTPLKSFPGIEPDQSYRVGTLEDMPVLIETKRGQTRLVASPTQREPVSAVLAARGWL